MNAYRRWAALVPLGLCLAMLGGLAGCKSQPDSDDEKPAAQGQNAPAQISVKNGETVVTLDAATQARLGLVAAPLTATVSHEEQTLPAVALSASDLAAARNSYLAAQAQLEKARIEADVSGKEYARLKALGDQDQNVSQKSLEAAQGTLQADQSDLRAAERQIALQKSMVAQDWGGTVAQWTQEDSPEFERVLAQTEALVQVTLPGDTSLVAPKSVWLETLEGARMEARMVSAYPKVDPRIQGRSYLYLATPPATLAPGTNLAARVAVGGTRKGMIVPSPAVVWSEGTAWVYLQTAGNEFTRRAVATDEPVAGGFFVSPGLPAEDKIVTVGAQALLSEEFLLRGAGGGENDEN